ncbi:MAG: alkaline phosphatase family protein [Betaproteobacteria bacterium]|uniref:Alkaline phosphatase family protein n=1 Tax=Candidatus Proximibacter danicus TaxID=2954365 RepID=A0A9D7K1Q8_9PROT|nr:alkaline phosphatase family protein [Candidatus Proximibacter danicus]
MSALLPDYAGGSIANLMRSVADACGASALEQQPLDPRFGLDSRTLSRARNIVLFVVDGMGAGLLESCGIGKLRQHAGKRLTSVFPSTTATAIPTFMTGLLPARHALTGWHMWLDELQAVTAVLPLKPRVGTPFKEAAESLPAKLFDHASIYGGMHRPAWVLSPQEIAFSPFNAWHARGADTLAYADLDGLFDTLSGLLQIPGRKYIYAYWPTLDSTAHRFGIDSKEVRATLERFCTGFDAMCETVRGSDTQMLVTADHGFINSPGDRVIQLEDHPELADMLARPLCGEQRVAWCYLKPGAEADFERCARARLGARAEIVSRQRLLGGNWFGPAPAHAKLASRIGDFALVMQENWSIKDTLKGEHPHRILGVHGGVSAEEMWVPLVTLQL